jgi:hypothetical protein
LTARTLGAGVARRPLRPPPSGSSLLIKRLWRISVQMQKAPAPEEGI